MGLSSILLSSSILANSFLSPSPSLTIEEFYFTLSNEVAENFVSNLDGSFKENYSIDDFYFDGYYEEEDSFYVPVVISLVYPNDTNFVDGFYRIDISANASYDYSFNFLGVRSYNLVGYVNIDEVDREMFSISRPYIKELGSYQLEYSSSGQDFQYILVVDGDTEVLFDESLPEFVLNSGETPNTIYLNDYFIEVENVLNTLDLKVEDKSFFGVLSDTMVNYIKSLTDNFKNLTNLFYVDNKLTFLGILTLIGFGIGITKWGINLVVDLLR